MKKLALFLITLSFFNCRAQEEGHKAKDTNSVLKIGDQVWMKSDLKVAQFTNGDPIPLAQTDEDWLNATANELPAYCVNYGHYFYNHYAVTDVRGIAPEGYRIPDKKDIEKLANHFGGLDTAGYYLQYQNAYGDSTIGFNVNPEGHRGHVGSYWYTQNPRGDYWLLNEVIKNPDEFKNHVTEASLKDKLHIQANQFSIYWYEPEMFIWSKQKGSGLSVRCIKK